MKQFRVTVRFRMNWTHFDSSLTDYIMNRLKNEMAQHIDKLEIERVESKPDDLPPSSFTPMADSLTDHVMSRLKNEFEPEETKDTVS